MTPNQQSRPTHLSKLDSYPVESPFAYRGGELFCEYVPVAAIAAATDTPVYVYSTAAFMGRAEGYLQAARDVSGNGASVCYALKANANPTILRMLFAAGLGADVTSGGELFLALHAGAEPQKIIFSGVGKTSNEIAEALSAGIRAIHAESEMELAAVASVAEQMGVIAPVGVRVNPNIDAVTHPYISTGLRGHKFGVSRETAITMYRFALGHEFLNPVGVASHIGSQITQLGPYAEAAGFLVALASELEDLGVHLEYIDIGGGLGIDYLAPAPDATTFVHTVGPIISAAGYELVIEPGRSIIGPAGGLLTRVLYVKQEGDKHFVIVDAGMTDLIRPTLYQAHHPVMPASESDQSPILVDIVGPICETGDFLARDRLLSPVLGGELLCVLHAGAYGFAMSSNYNGRLRPAEVLVDGDTFRIIRERQTYRALLEGIRE